MSQDFEEQVHSKYMQASKGTCKSAEHAAYTVCVCIHATYEDVQDMCLHEDDDLLMYVLQIFVINESKCPSKIPCTMNKYTHARTLAHISSDLLYTIPLTA